MRLEEFQAMSTAEVATLVRQKGPQVCGFPVNGTRRWFMLEHPTAAREDFAAQYLTLSGKRQIELYQLFFDHGIHTLLSPIFGAELLSRGDAYIQLIAAGLAGLAQWSNFLDFYQTYGVRVRFYGDYRKYFIATPYAYLIDVFEDITALTASNDRHLLLYGLFAHDPTETIGELAVQHYVEQGIIPHRNTLVTLYYGEYVPPVDLFIGFDALSVFDMPLLAVGEEDLYFTVSPSSYLDTRQLRDILYDHLYTRRGGAGDYTGMSGEEWALMKAFYHQNKGRTLGVGAIQPRGGYWYPTPQVQLPENFAGGGSSTREKSS